MNSVNLVGRLTRDADLRYTPNGDEVAQITVAVNRPWTNADSERDADFISCVAFKKTAELIADHFSKGSQIGIDGRIQTRSYEHEEKGMVYVTEVAVERIHFLDPKPQDDNKKSSKGGNKNARSNNGNRTGRR